LGLLSGTFGIEESWLRKGLKQIRSNPLFFAKNNKQVAQQELGMGNKQVEALIDWLVSSNLVRKHKENRISKFILTEFGELVANYDPDLSEDGTYWVIHYFFSMDNDKLWFYYWYINEFEANTFLRKELEIGLSGVRNTSEKVINDFCVLPLLQTMRKTRLGKPFGIMIEDAQNRFKRIEPPEEKLDPIIVAYMTMDWAKKNDRSSANLLELTGAKCSPGKILHLSTKRYSEYLDKIQSMFNREVLWVSYTAGLNSVAFEKNIRLMTNYCEG
jgi:hypothetical protein